MQLISILTTCVLRSREGNVFTAVQTLILFVGDGEGWSMNNLIKHPLALPQQGDHTPLTE